MAGRQELESTWIGRANRPKTASRILPEYPAQSYHAKHRAASADFFEYRLNFGDNPPALFASEWEIA
ncbi:MAG: hypothetical protein IT510_16585 [Sulfuritalea sp.]|jgi:adenine-specific DNA-methyltransferase|nr:hypothetical protein [Sulfuritalea sp.]